MEPYTFQYGPKLEKNEIRILSLRWAEEDTQRLEGTLLIRKLEINQIPVEEETQGLLVNQPEGEKAATEPYEALSYPWGDDPNETEQIWLRVGEENDPSGEAGAKSPAGPKNATRKKAKPYQITKNLKSALLLLRSQIKPPEYVRRIWVDALCINQNNDDEKSIQIPLMAEIYSHATRVCIWLGADTKPGESKKACDFVNTVTQFDHFDELVVDNDMTEQWDAFCSLLKRPWFSRRWIVQEIAVARGAIMYCGTGEVNWNDFADAVSLFSSRPEELRVLFKRASEKHHNPNYLGVIEKLGASWLSNKLTLLFRRAENGRGRVLEHLLSLEALMSDLTLFEAGDPRDTLYAILWLANDVRKTGPSHHLEYHSRVPSKANSPTEKRHVVNATFSEDPKTTHEEIMSTLSKHSASTKLPGLQPEILESPAQSIAPPRPFHDLDTLPVTTQQMAEDDRHSAKRQRRNSTSIQVPTRILSTGSWPASVGTDRSNSDVDNMRRGKRRPSLALPVNLDPPSADHGISYKGPELMIHISYKKPVYDVCIDFLDHVFSRFGYIDMMCRPWAPEPDNKVEPWNPPSWMLTVKKNVAFELDDDRLYRRIRADPLVGSPGLNVTRNYNASGHTRAFEQKLNEAQDAYIYPPSFDPKHSLNVKGFAVAKVWKRSEPAAYGNIPGEWLDLIPEIAPFQKWDHTSARERPPAPFWRTLVADRGLDGVSHPPRYFEMACKWVYKKVKKTQGLNTSEKLTHGSCPTHVAEFLKRVQCVVWQRRLVVAVQPENGDRLLCLAPKDVKRGDMICIIYGCSVPVVLREQDARSNEGEDAMDLFVSDKTEKVASSGEKPPPTEKWFKFIGECYVHDMMNGEVFRHRRKFYDKKLNVRSFELR